MNIRCPGTGTDSSAELSKLERVRNPSNPHPYHQLSSSSSSSSSSLPFPSCQSHPRPLGVQDSRTPGCRPQGCNLLSQARSLAFQNATGSHRQPQAATGCHRMPQAARTQAPKPVYSMRFDENPGNAMNILRMNGNQREDIEKQWK